MRDYDFKPYELFYYERGNKLTTRCVESFRTKSELLKRIDELRAMPEHDFVFPDYDTTPA
jgi:hypothetical protein